MAGAIVLDWDGTLVDSRARSLVSFAEVLTRARGLAPAPKEVALLLRGTVSETFERIGFGAAHAAELNADYEQTYRSPGRPPAKPFPGVIHALRWWRSQGWHLAVVTAKARSLMEIDDPAGLLLDQVEALVCDGAARPKPDPDGVIRACAACGALPEHSVLVGDSVNDVLAGRAARCRTIGVLYGFFPSEISWSGADALARRTCELPRRVEALRFEAGDGRRSKGDRLRAR